MEHEQMSISEVWRWRFLAIWVVIFTVLVGYSLYRVHRVEGSNRDALCAIRKAHLTIDRSLKVLLERNGLDVVAISLDIEEEQAALSSFGCDD